MIVYEQVTFSKLEINKKDSNERINEVFSIILISLEIIIILFYSFTSIMWNHYFLFIGRQFLKKSFIFSKYVTNIIQLISL